jgi:hypothetical protein
MGSGSRRGETLPGLARPTCGRAEVRDEASPASLPGPSGRRGYGLRARRTSTAVEVKPGLESIGASRRAERARVARLEVPQRRPRNPRASGQRAWVGSRVQAMRLPRPKEKNGGGMILSQGWRKNAYPRSRLSDPLAALEREDPASRRYGGAPVFDSQQMQNRRPWRRR